MKPRTLRKIFEVLKEVGFWIIATTALFGASSVAYNYIKIQSETTEIVEEVEELSEVIEATSEWDKQAEVWNVWADECVSAGGIPAPIRHYSTHTEYQCFTQ